MKYELRTSPSQMMERFFNEDTFTYGTELDIYKKDDKFMVELEMAGFEKEDIDVQFKGDILSIRAERQEKSEKEDKEYFYQSRSYGNIHRQIRFSGVDEENVEATYTNGVLKVNLPTKVKSGKINKIEIK